jgi:hypothetical protein
MRTFALLTAATIGFAMAGCSEQGTSTTEVVADPGATSTTTTIEARSTARRSAQPRQVAASISRAGTPGLPETIRDQSLLRERWISYGFTGTPPSIDLDHAAVVLFEVTADACTPTLEAWATSGDGTVTASWAPSTEACYSKASRWVIAVEVPLDQNGPATLALPASGPADRAVRIPLS